MEATTKVLVLGSSSACFLWSKVQIWLLLLEYKASFSPKQIYILLLQKDAAFNLKSKVIREEKLTAMEPLICVRQPVQVISVSPASPLWSRRGHYPCGGKKGSALPGRAICPKTTSASNQQVQRLNFLPLDSKPMVFELHPSAAACVHIFLSKIKGNGKKFSIMLYT